MSFSLAGGANITPLNPLAGFEGPFSRWGKREEREGKRGKERKEKDRRNGRKHPKIHFWLGVRLAGE